MPVPSAYRCEVINSDRDQTEAIDILRGHVGDTEIIGVSRPQGGWGNLSIKIDTAIGSFIVTKCTARTEADVRDMADLLIDLESFDFPSPRLVPHRDGRVVSEWRDFPALVKRFIVGTTPKGIVENDPSEFGEIVARLHLATDGHEIQRPHEFGRKAFPDAKPLAASDPVAAWLMTMHDRIESAIDLTLPTGLVHGDLTVDNLVRSPGGSLSIIDFEEMCRETLLFDLGMIVFTLAEADQWSDDLESSAVVGYESVRRLTTAEKEAVPLFVSYAATAIAFVRYRERRIHGGTRVAEGAWTVPQRIADAAWVRFAGS